jgi:hypothetical protein
MPEESPSLWLAASPVVPPPSTARFPPPSSADEPPREELTTKKAPDRVWLASTEAVDQWQLKVDGGTTNWTTTALVEFLMEREYLAGPPSAEQFSRLELLLNRKRWELEQAQWRHTRHVQALCDAQEAAGESEDVGPGTGPVPRRLAHQFRSTVIRTVGAKSRRYLLDSDRYPELIEQFLERRSFVNKLLEEAVAVCEE